MAKLVTFVARSAHDALQNQLDFIELCRTKLKPFGRNIDFDEDAWDTSGIGGKSQPYNSYLCFTRLGTKVRGTKGKPPSLESADLLREPFRPFAKALISYMHGLQPTTNIRVRLNAFRYLEVALYEKTGACCPSVVMPQILNYSCTLMKMSTAYDTSKQLELIYKFMVQLGLAAAPPTWRTPIPPPQIRRNRVGKEFDAERARKLPNPAALEALATIFRSSSSDPREIAVSSICALMLCAPDRITEVLHLPLDCLTSDWKDQDTGELGTGVRWFPLKGAAPMTKTVIPSMSDIAKRAITQLKQVSEPARVVACWYEANPNHIYLPAHLEYLRNTDLLSMTELGLVLFDGAGGRGRAREWAKTNRLPLTKGGKRQQLYVPFHAVQERVLSLLPRNFPIMDPDIGMRFSEALCIARPGEFDSRGVPIQCCVVAINYPLVRTALTGARNQKSIFAVRGLTDQDGSPLHITTHMMRHYLNTLARQGGKLTEEDIAKWSGRMCVGQNKVYNHVSDRDMLDHIRKSVGDPALAIGPLANINNRVFITRDKFAALKILTAHTTELGYCPHDFTMLPCQIHRDCINCSEHLCVKGDATAEANLRQLQKETCILLDKAKAAMKQEEYGANEWVKHQTLTLNRVNQLIAILDDPAVPVGSVIQLSGILPASRVAQAIEQRASLQQDTPLSQTMWSLDNVRALLTDAEPTQKVTYVTPTRKKSG